MNKYPFGVPYKFYIEKNYNSVRRNKLKLIYDILNQNERFRNEIIWMEQVDIGEKIEKEFYKETMAQSNIRNIRKDWENIKFLTMYNSISYRVLCNLDKNSIVKSNYLLEQILEGKIKIKKITKLSSSEMSPESNAKIIKEIEEKNTNEVERRFSTLHQCDNCKNYTCVTENRYNRGLDEGSNVIIICVTCGHKRNG